MVEVEGLKVTISAEVKNAIENLYKVQTNITKLGNVTKKETEKIGGFLTKWKMGWIAVGGAAIASLYGLAKSSAYMNMWFAEATGALGYFMDSALEPLSPLIETVLGWLWQLADWFAGLPEVVRGAVGALTLAIGALAGLNIIDFLLGKMGLATLSSRIAAMFTGLGTSILAAIGAGIGIGVTAVWILDKLGILKAIDEAGRNIEAQIPTIWQIVKWLTAPLGALGSIVINLVRGQFSNILPDLKRILWDETFAKVWKYVQDMTANIPIIGKLSKGYFDTMNNAWNYVAGSYASGTNYVPETGLYQLHRGEAVIPRGKSTNNTETVINFSPTININNPSVKSDMDVRELANKLTSYWRDDMTRYARGVT